MVGQVRPVGLPPGERGDVDREVAGVLEFHARRQCAGCGQGRGRQRGQGDHHVREGQSGRLAVEEALVAGVAERGLPGGVPVRLARQVAVSEVVKQRLGPGAWVLRAVVHILVHRGRQDQPDRTVQGLSTRVDAHRLNRPVGSGMQGRFRLQTLTVAVDVGVRTFLPRCVRTDVPSSGRGGGSAAGISFEIDVPTRDTRAMSRSTSSEPIERGWDEPWYRVRMEGFEASFLPSDGEDLDEVCNVDVFVTLEDGSRWTATVFTVTEVERLMKLWAGTDEALGGRYFWVSDGLIVRDPGFDSMTEVIAGLIGNGEFSEIFQPVINN